MGNRKKQKFIGLLAQKALNGEISQALFKKLELAVNYSDELKVQEIGDGAALAVVDWLKRRGLERVWTYHKRACPDCSKDSFAFENKDLMLVICPNCMGDKIALPLPVASPTQELERMSARAQEVILGDNTSYFVASPAQQLQHLSARSQEAMLGEKTRQPVASPALQQQPVLAGPQQAI